MKAIVTLEGGKVIEMSQYFLGLSNEEMIDTEALRKYLEFYYMNPGEEILSIGVEK